MTRKVLVLHPVEPHGFSVVRAKHSFRIMSKEVGKRNHRMGYQVELPMVFDSWDPKDCLGYRRARTTGTLNCLRGNLYT